MRASIAERMARSGAEAAERARRIKVRLALWLGVIAAILAPLFYFGMRSG